MLDKLARNYPWVTKRIIIGDLSKDQTGLSHPAKRIKMVIILKFFNWLAGWLKVV